MSIVPIQENAENGAHGSSLVSIWIISLDPMLRSKRYSGRVRNTKHMAHNLLSLERLRPELDDHHWQSCGHAAMSGSQPNFLDHVGKGSGYFGTFLQCDPDDSPAPPE
jgi:hypothetical protein